MTKELTTQEQADFDRKIRAMAGQMVGGSENFIPKLNVNKNPEDQEGNDIPVGGFKVKTKNQGTVYSKRKEGIQFRLFAKRYGYVAYDSKGGADGKGATVARSVLLPDFNKGSEYISDDGSLKAGKANPKTPTTRVSCKIEFFGLATFDGVSPKGEPIRVENEPMRFTIGGKPFLSVDGYLKDFGKDGRLFFDYMLTVTPVHKGEGFYNIELQFTDLTNKLEFGEEGFKTLQTFYDYIEANNKAIEVKFNQALKNKPTAEDSVGADIVENAPLEDDFAEDEEEHEED